MMEPVDGAVRCPRCSRVEQAGLLQTLFVVTGASGSGKTALLAPLSRILAGTAVTFDVDLLLDSAGMLSDGRPIEWPAFRNAWLSVAHGVAQCGLPTVLLGPFTPGQLEPLPARRWVGEIRFLLLDCSDEVRLERLEARPPWRRHDIEEQTKFGRWLRETMADAVDTALGSPEDSAQAVAAWVAKYRRDL
jgi:hypothetical protein